MDLEKKRARQREWYWRHREEVCRRKREEHNLDLDRQRAKRRAHYVANRELEIRRASDSQYARKYGKYAGVRRKIVELARLLKEAGGK